MSKVFKWFKHLIQRNHLDWNWISYVFPFSLCLSSYTFKILAERIKFNFVVVGFTCMVFYHHFDIFYAYIIYLFFLIYLTYFIIISILLQYYFLFINFF